MHQYLNAVGFDNIRTKNDLREILADVRERFTHQTIVSYKPGEDFCELRKEYGQCIGISLCGELDENDVFDPDYTSPISREAESALTPILLLKESLRKNSMSACVKIQKSDSVLYLHCRMGSNT